MRTQLSLASPAFAAILCAPKALFLALLLLPVAATPTFTVETAGFLAQTTQERIARDPLVAFVAKGPPNSCGRGCDRWIAIEGAFDKGSAERIGQFLDARPNFPVYFHSRGGLIQEAVMLGKRLRKLRMKASVARTALTGCAGHATSLDCRKIVQSMDHHQAQLRHGEGLCNSACVYAFIGASTRVASTGKLGVHDFSSTRPEKSGPTKGSLSHAPDSRRENVLRELKKYAAEMGVNSALIERAAKVPSTRIEVLTRAELTGYGVIVGDSFQSPWAINDLAAPVKIFVFKTLTRPSSRNGAEHRMTTMSIQCFTGSGISLVIERELALGEKGHEPTVRIASDKNEIWVSDNTSNTSEQYDVRTLRVPSEKAMRFVPKQSLRYSETYSSGEWSGKSFEVEISLTGLEAGLGRVFRHCPAEAEMFRLHKTSNGN